MTYNAELAWTGHTTTQARYAFAGACPQIIAHRIASVTRRNDAFAARMTDTLKMLSAKGEPEYINFGESADGVWVLKAWME